jgi:hypothetical protein
LLAAGNRSLEDQGSIRLELEPSLEVFFFRFVLLSWNDLLSALNDGIVIEIDFLPSIKTVGRSLTAHSSSSPSCEIEHVDTVADVDRVTLESQSRV